MATPTTAPGLLSIDPIQGLVDYVYEIKPYHSKIFEVLFEYVYADVVKTTVTDVLELSMDLAPSYVISTQDPAVDPDNPSGPPLSVPNQLWYDPSTQTFYIRDISNTYWIVYQTQLTTAPIQASSNSVDTTMTEFMETIEFNWGGTYTFTIIGVSGNQITISGNYSAAILVQDIAQIDSNPTTEVTDVTYDIINNQTIVEVADPTGAAISGTLGIQDVDITYWYEFAVLDVNPGYYTPPPQTPTFAGIEFCWGGTNSINQPQMCGGTNQFFIPSGDFTSYFTIGLDLVISNAKKLTDGMDSPNNGRYSVLSSAFVANQGTYVLVQLSVGPPTSGTLPFAPSTSGLCTLFGTSSAQASTNMLMPLGGSGYTPGTYLNVPLILAPGAVSSGSGAEATIVVEDIVVGIDVLKLGTVISIELTNLGSGYSSVDLLTVDPTDLGVIGAFVGTNTQSYYRALVSPQSVGSVNPVNLFTDVPSLSVLGNATTSVQVGAVFQVSGSPANDGTYRAVYLQYEPISNTTTIGVAPSLGGSPLTLTTAAGGLVIPYRFINEVFAGSYDNGGYDTQPYDESAGSMIHQGP